MKFIKILKVDNEPCIIQVEHIIMAYKSSCNDKPCIKVECAYNKVIYLNTSIEKLWAVVDQLARQEIK